MSLFDSPRESHSPD